MWLRTCARTTTGWQGGRCSITSDFDLVVLYLFSLHFSWPVAFVLSINLKYCWSYQCALMLVCDAGLRVRSHEKEACPSLFYLPRLCTWFVSQGATASSKKLCGREDSEQENKQFSCDQCDYRCSERSSLTRHMRTHSGEKPFSCDQCDFRSSQRSHLTTHTHAQWREAVFLRPMWLPLLKQK